MRRLLVLLAVVNASELSSTKPGKRIVSRTRSPPLAAFQVTEPIYELTPEQLAGGKPYLIQFTGKGDDYCKSMEPLKERLKDELGVEIRCFEVWYGTQNLDLLQKLDRGRCGGVPFFYNKKSRRFICGATTYANLKAWALCQPCEPFLPPPNINANKEPNEVQAKVQGFFSGLKAKAEDKMASRRGERS